MTHHSLSRVAKSAIVLLTFGKDLAADIIKNLDPEEAKVILTAIANLKYVNSDTAEKCIEEFYSELISPSKSPAIIGDSKTSRNFVGQHTNIDQDESVILSEILKPIPPKDLAKLVEQEHPQVIAVILAFCGPKKAGHVIKHLERTLQIEAVTRLSRLDQIQASTIALIVETLESANTRLNEIDSMRPLGGSDKVINFLKSLDEEKATKMLEHIRTADPKLAKKIALEWHSFKDIIKLSKADMAFLIANIRRETLLISLRGEIPELVEAYTNQMSKRASGLFIEDLASGPKVEKREVQLAQAELIEKVLEFAKSGSISNPFCSLE